MPITTKIDCAGIVRDSAPTLADGASGVRRAEECVVRSPGVIESRPNFELLYEQNASAQARAMNEFQDALFVLTEDVVFGDWALLNATTGVHMSPAFSAGTLIYEPVDFDQSEVKFAESRGNMYMTAQRGVVVVENQSTVIAPYTRTAGVEMWCVTDWRGPDSYGIFDPGPGIYGVVGYRFVFVRTDSNDYIRRSPPSQQIVTTCTPGADGWGSGTRFYIPTNGTWQLAAGDQVEFYRSLSVDAPGPIAPEYFLAQSYTLTSGDIAAGYFAPPADSTPERLLGAALYTNATQGGAIAAKYTPPQAQALAWWNHVMWYGRTASKHRSKLIALRHLYRAGRAAAVYSATFVSGSPAVTVTGDTSDIQFGMRVTDVPTLEEWIDPRVAGTYVPANTTVSAVGAGGFTMSANASANGTVSVAFFPSTLPAQGLIAERTGSGSYTSGSPTVTGLTSTSGWAAGMYWTDAAHGPTEAGTYVPAGTTILNVVSGTSVTLSANATSTGSTTARVGDIVTLDGTEFYAWIAMTTGTLYDTSSTAEVNHNVATPWSASWVRCFAIHSPISGVTAADTVHTTCADFGLESAVVGLCNWINWSALSLGVAAVPAGTMPMRDALSRPTSNGTLLHAVTPGSATSFVLEEMGLGDTAAHELDSTCPSAFSPQLFQKTTNDAAPSRLYWSDPDEPESVPLLNYTQIGSSSEPILAVVPLRSALLVFKTDGIWRVSGAAPSSWQVDMLDGTLRAIRPETITTMNNTAYAWCLGGFYEITESGVRSLSAGRIDVELRAYADPILGSSSTHGAFVETWQARQLVLLGVPAAEGDLSTTRVYAYCATTNAWTQWDHSWTTVAHSKRDGFYIALAVDSPNAIEVRYGVAPRGYDRTFTIYPTAIGATLTVPAAGVGNWEPALGDFVTATYSGLTLVRRITALSYASGTWTITLESDPTQSVLLVDDVGDYIVDDVGNILDVSFDQGVWGAREAAIVTVEWHPASPSGIPVGVIGREMQIQMDLRDAPDQAVTQSSPYYEVGASNDRTAIPVLVTSTAGRTGATVQPIRVGVSRQVARSALLAPMLVTSDVFPLRCVGASIVFEGTSEKTRR